MALPADIKAMFDKLQAAVAGKPAPAPEQAEPVVNLPKNEDGRVSIQLQADGSGLITIEDGSTHVVPPEFAGPLYAAHISAMAISDHANRMLDNRTKQIVIQHPETGLVTDVLRADNDEIHGKALEKLAQGRHLNAVKQHFALRDQQFEIVQYIPPEER